jgi:glycosyltransferase involved in cell wall biosynthesis
MKLAITIPHLGTGGSERTAAELANYAAKNGVDVDVILMSNADVFYELDSRITVHKPGFPKKNRFVYYLKIIRYMRRTLKALRSDALVVLGYNLIPALAALGLSTELVGTHRTSPQNRLVPLKGKTIFHTLFQKIYRITLKWAYLRYDKMIYQTEIARELLHGEYRSDCQATVLPNFLRKIKEYPVTKRKQIVSVGRLSVEKGHRFLVEAFARLGETDWRLALVGDGWRREELEQQVRDLGIADRVDFLGYQSEVDRHMQESEIFVLPSLIEGMPNALIEAMANGLACVSFDCQTGPAELIDHGVNGFLVETGNVEELAQRIQELIDDDALRQRLARNARQLREEYQLDKIGKKHLDFIME